ncbi:SLH domain, hydrolase [Alkalihalophilus pseudofirmus OF4]|uniref:SLH domain, hydrolase n=1 Tax=Alkalihalophilus pseudofirmus (strain ATCC BAA-2126 / JCM 17055 / OF4) TaxID=398511 RepID=D3FZI7_ALKPO|nr:S-layer homology domain-containing protein [Alkalihalophilus pseudofirmus]ADC49229.1 SLH domain, hydrolase [Alkalihalophilus pseudofirmus OF4]
MKELKKIFTLFLAVLLSFTAIVPMSASAQTRDFDSYFLFDVWDHWGADQLDDLVNADIFGGYKTSQGDYEFRPNRTITRAEFAAIIVRSLQLTRKSASTSYPFTDVPANHALRNEIAIASDHGIIAGLGGGKFGPNQNVTREQIASMIVRAFSDTISFTGGTAKNFTDVPAGHWAAADIKKASSIGLVSGVSQTTFGMGRAATRGEAGVLLHRALNRETKNLTSADTLVSLANSYQTSLFSLDNATKAQLTNHINTYYTGFQKAFATEIYEYGYLADMNITGELTFTVKSNHTRFAQVKGTGATMTFEYYDPDKRRDVVETVDYEPTFYMKKIGSSWKIYYVEDFSFDFEEDYLY